MLGRFGMRMPTDVLLLSRALATVDGTLRVLAPEMTLMAAVAEVVSEPRDVLPPPQEMVRDELIGALPRLRLLPERVDRLLAAAGRGELRLRTIVDEDQGRILRTLVNRVPAGVRRGDPPRGVGHAARGHRGRPGGGR